MAPPTDEHRSWVVEIAWEVAKALREDIRADRLSDIALHQAKCPARLTVEKAKWMMIGAVLAGAVAGGGGVLGLISLFK